MNGPDPLQIAEPNVDDTTKYWRPVGAFLSSAGVTYRAWAPERTHFEVIVTNQNGETRTVPLLRDVNGYFSGLDSGGYAGDLYWHRIEGKALTPDIASRYQPEGVFGPSMVVASEDYQWKVTSWRRPRFHNRVIYEIHVGTFTREGTFEAAISKLDYLVDLGINTIELMPLADFPGRWNWGYDGVFLFAPARCYGPPDALRKLVDAAHERGLAVILDVVYNHLGPVGNPMKSYTERYFHSSKETPWGTPFNLDEGDSGPVRGLFIQNAMYWLDEFRFDGLRLDATHAVHDVSERHLFSEIGEAARERGAFTIAEDDRNETTVISSPTEAGWGLDAIWADDFHHSVRVALTRQNESYFASYAGTSDEIVATIDQGWYYSGQEYPHWGKPRGKPARHIPTERFVVCLSNHDQVGNRAMGDRLHHAISPEAYRAASVLLCMVPYTPMLFMGQEWGTKRPFLYFSDFSGDLGKKMAYYRRKEFESQQMNQETVARMPDPQKEETYRACQIEWEELQQPGHKEIARLYRDCLRLRAREEIFQNPARTIWSVFKAGESSIALRWTADGQEWLLLCKLIEGESKAFGKYFEKGNAWTTVLFSNAAAYGEEQATPELCEANFRIFKGPAAWLLKQTTATNPNADAEVAHYMTSADE